MATWPNQNKSCINVKIVNLDMIEINCIDQHFDKVREDNYKRNIAIIKSNHFNSRLLG